MTWLNKHHRIWRTAILLLVGVSLMGPWTGDRLSVPEEYGCSPPYIRTEGDMCDMIGVFGLISGFLSTANWLVTSPPADLGRVLFFLGSYLLFLLPVFTTFLCVLLAKGDRRSQALVWALAVIAIISWSLIGAFPPSWMWGLRLHVGVAIGALTLEVLALLTGNRPGLEVVRRAGYR